VLLISLAGCGSGDPTAAEGALIFEDGFLEPVSEVEILREGGVRVRGLNAWLKLLPKGDLRPRHEEEYQYRDCDQVAAWFNRVLGVEELDAGNVGLVCLEYRNPDFDFDNGRWLLQDRHSGIFYYRVWKQF
jgi:hypothetical protein